MLQGEIDAVAYPLMEPEQTLDSEENFGLRPLPVDKLHVLVVLPLEDIDDVPTQDGTRKRKYEHSQIDARACQELLSDLTIRAEGVPSIPLRRPDNAPVAEGFDWSSLSVGQTEEETPSLAQQRNMYQAYLARHLDDVLKTEKLCVVGVPEDLKVLTVGVRDIQFTGQPDLLILSEHARNDPSGLQFLPDVQMLVEVKQRVGPGDDFASSWSATMVPRVSFGPGRCY
jgi:hypothetical protein